MSAQLEDGYTRTANELLERLMKIKLNGTQHNIVYCIIRNTYGFQRKSHAMSLTFISTAIEAHKDLVKRELDKLIESKIVKVFKDGDYTHSREIGLNKNVSDWIVHSKPISRQSPNQSTVSESVYLQSPNQSSPSVDQSVYQERKVFKENLKENTTLSNYKILEDEVLKLHAKGENDLKNDEVLAMHDVIRLGIPIPFIVDTMKQMKNEKKLKGEKVQSFVYYHEAIKERFNKPLTAVKTFKKNETDWDKIEKQLEDAERGFKTGA